MNDDDRRDRARNLTLQYMQDAVWVFEELGVKVRGNPALRDQDLIEVAKMIQTEHHALAYENTLYVADGPDLFHIPTGDEN